MRKKESNREFDATWNKREVMSYREFVVACKEIAKRVDKSRIKNIFGIPRGGLVLAVYLSHMLDLPLVMKPSKDSLIADDIADTGQTLKPYKNHYIVTLYYHKQSIVIPDIWIREKKSRWIKYPWEVDEKGKI